MTLEDFPKHTEQCWRSVIVVLHEHARLAAKCTGFVPSPISHELECIERFAIHQFPTLRSFVNLAYNSDNVVYK